MTNPQKSFLFTWSPKLVTKDPNYTYDFFVEEYFKSWEKCMDSFEVNPEFNKSGNLHFHGYFILKEKESYSVRWYTKILPKLKYNGFIKIDKCSDLSKAIVYARKDRALMLKCLKKAYYPVPLVKNFTKLRVSTDKHSIQLAKNNLGPIDRWLPTKSPSLSL